MFQFLTYKYIIISSQLIYSKLPIEKYIEFFSFDITRSKNIKAYLPFWPWLKNRTFFQDNNTSTSSRVGKIAAAKFLLTIEKGRWGMSKGTSTAKNYHLLCCWTRGLIQKKMTLESSLLLQDLFELPESTPIPLYHSQKDLVTQYYKTIAIGTYH